MKAIFLVTLVASIFQFGSVQAQTTLINGGEVFQGDEFINEHPTGQKCYLYTDKIQSSAIGKHCYAIDSRIYFSNESYGIPSYSLKLTVGLTNYHRPEFPQVKTCATSLDGKTSGNDIYGQDTQNIYNKFYSAETKYNGNQLDVGVLFSFKTKLPKEVRVHKMNAMSETDYDCNNLTHLNPVAPELKLSDINILNNTCYAIDLTKTWSYVDGSKHFAVFKDLSDSCMKERKNRYYAEVSSEMLVEQNKINSKK